MAKIGFRLYLEAAIFYLILAGDGKLSNMPKAPTKEGLPINRQAFLFSVV